jgi:ABC-type transporter MlaC component
MGEQSSFGLISRRAALQQAAGAAAVTIFGISAGPAIAAKEGSAVAYLKGPAAKDLFAAARAKTPESFLTAINRHADLDAIAKYSLGSYSERLTPPMSARLRRGVAGFMSRFFALQSHEYPVSKAEIGGEYPYSEHEAVVKTRIYLESGTSYSVDWLMAPHGHRYKIRDVRVYGFWLSPFQRSLFVRYIAENGGDVKALLAALRV